MNKLSTLLLATCIAIPTAYAAGDEHPAAAAAAHGGAGAPVAAPVAVAPAVVSETWQARRKPLEVVKAKRLLELKQAAESANRIYISMALIDLGVTPSDAQSVLYLVPAERWNKLHEIISEVGKLGLGKHFKPYAVAMALAKAVPFEQWGDLAPTMNTLKKDGEFYEKILDKAVYHIREKLNPTADAEYALLYPGEAAARAAAAGGAGGH
jgi:hypothetical protein